MYACMHACMYACMYIYAIIAIHIIHQLGFQPHNTRIIRIYLYWEITGFQNVASPPSTVPGHCADKHVLGCSMSSKGAGVEEAKASGLYSRHVYSLLKVMKLEKRAGMGQGWVQISRWFKVSYLERGSTFRTILLIFIAHFQNHYMFLRFDVDWPDRDGEELEWNPGIQVC